MLMEILRLVLTVSCIGVITGEKETTAFLFSLYLSETIQSKHTDPK